MGTKQKNTLLGQLKEQVAIFQQLWLKTFEPDFWG